MFDLDKLEKFFNFLYKFTMYNLLVLVIFNLIRFFN
jgi:hypothetical protein